MLDVDKIRTQVQRNCDISDSKHAGLFSVCGLALRLRDLYKWDNGLAPWVERDAGEVLNWIGDRETLWETLEDKTYGPIHVNEKIYDPFDTDGINRVLTRHGIFYGAGFGRSLKPTFLLSRIQQEKTINGYSVYILGQEMARDLFTVPAFVQDNGIIVRSQAAQTFLWDAILYVTKSARPALARALKSYGLYLNQLNDLKKQLETISEIEAEIYIYHELGELQDTDFNQDVWREIIATYPHTAIELFARGVKDLLADTNAHGSLQYILKERRISSLAFYVAFMEGLPKKLFSAMVDAFEDFLKSGNWSAIEAAVAEGYHTAKTYANAMMRIFETGKLKKDYQWAEQEMTQQLLKPLGL
jgi:hypothetical protein